MSIFSGCVTQWDSYELYEKWFCEFLWREKALSFILREQQREGDPISFANLLIRHKKETVKDTVLAQLGENKQIHLQNSKESVSGFLTASSILHGPFPVDINYMFFLLSI